MWGLLCGAIIWCDAMPLTVSVVRFAKNFLYLWCLTVYSLDEHILKVFFAFVLVRKCGSFQERGQRTALISCVVVWLCTFLVCRYPILFRCGALYRLFSQRSFHNLLTNKRNQLHTFFLHITHRSWSCYGNVIWNATS